MPHCKISTDLNKLHVHVLANLMIISILRLKKDVVLRPNKLLSCVCKILIPSNLS